METSGLGWWIGVGSIGTPACAEMCGIFDEAGAFTPACAEMSGIFDEAGAFTPACAEMGGIFDEAGAFTPARWKEEHRWSHG